MAPSMLDNGLMTNSMVKVLKSGLMELVTKVNTSLAKNKDMGNSTGPMAVATMGSFSQTRSTVWDRTNGPMDEYTQVNGETIKCMEMARSHGKMDGNTWDRM